MRKDFLIEQNRQKQKTKWPGQIEKLSTFINKKGYKIVFEKNNQNQDLVDYNSKIITISSGHSKEIAFYCLLHEIGHVILLGSQKKYKRSYEEVWQSFSTSSLTYRVTTLQEELDAWQEGLILAQKMSLEIDRKKFEITKTKCISTYLSWATLRVTTK